MLAKLPDNVVHLPAAAGPSILVRRLLIDLETPFSRHWFGNDPFRTAFFNALSQGFPPGEQMFIDSVRETVKRLPQDLQEEYQSQVKGFIGQEATHRRIHSLFNTQLEKQGLRNAWMPRAQRRLARIEKWSPMHKLALTASYEHFTNLLAIWTLSHQEIFAGVEPRIAALWLWHAAEEAEHASVAYDIYEAAGGRYGWRVFWFVAATIIFASDSWHQTWINLRRDGTLWKWSSWKNGAAFMFGQQGLLRHAFRPWKSYFSRTFHPSQHTTPEGRQWLDENYRNYAVISNPQDR